MNEHDERELARLYRNAAREKSPAHLDTRILEAAARRTRSRRIHARLRQLALAAAAAGLALAIPRWVDHEPIGAASVGAPGIEQRSALTQSLLDLRAPELSRSAVSRCLLRSDLCSNESRPQP